MMHGQRASGLVVHEHGRNSARGQVATNNHDWDIVLLEVCQQVGLFEYPTGDHDYALGAPFENHLQIAVEARTLGLRVHQQRQIVGGLQARLDAAHCGDAEGIG